MGKAGKVMNKAKSELENKLQKPIVTNKNYLDLTQNKEILEIK